MNLTQPVDNETIKVLQHNFDGRLPWLKGRQKYIGSSDSPALFGFGYENQSATTVWLSKVHDVDPSYTEADFQRMEEGRIGEQFVIAMFANRHPTWKVEHNPPFTITVCQDHPYLCASLDGQALIDQEQEQIVIEAKVITHLAHEWADGQTPPRYVIQVMHQLLCTGWKRGVIVGYVRGELQERWVERDEGMIEQMLIRYQWFWNHVKARTPPEDPKRMSYESLRVLTEYGTAKIAGKKLTDIARKYMELDKQHEQLTKELDELRNEIGRETLGAEYLLLPDQTCLKLGKKKLQYKPFLPRGIKTV